VEGIYEIYKKLEQKDVILSFKGMMTSELLTTILQIMESKMDRFEERPKIKKKVFNVLVECLQNLYHHIDHDSNSEKSAEERNALFMIAKNDSCYIITTGNYLPTEDVESLKSKIDLINKMTKTELKEYYKLVLNEGIMSDKGTAGLGMIDIARKSGKELDYEFLPIKNNLSFFSLSVKIEE
jgi:hypothetical protein